MRECKFCGQVASHEGFDLGGSEDSRPRNFELDWSDGKNMKVYSIDGDKQLLMEARMGPSWRVPFNWLSVATIGNEGSWIIDLI